MNKTNELQEHLDVLAKTMGITIQPEWRESVLAHLANAQRMAGILYTAPIDNNSLEMANSFRADPALPTQRGK